MQNYNPKKIEPKWQKYWEKKGLYKTPKDATRKNKMYILPQLPYPSGSGLHVGHAEVYNACDIYARYQRMKGKKVLQVMGWDSFGLPAENYAIKTNVHPRKSTEKAIDTFRGQIKSLGISVDWDREVASHKSDYYKWTQWFFLLFYKRGLAYRKLQSVNWCPSCMTVLANEQVTDKGTCERCDTVVIQRDMEQWFLKITDYADRLLKDLDKIDWPEETKERQRNWIGRSEGAIVKFSIFNSQFSIGVFTTRPDTLFGATYIVLAPEHPLVAELLTEETRNKKQETRVQNAEEMRSYIEATKLKTELDRQTQKEKTGGELKGIKAVNPANGEELPIWIADYVLGTYGTGAIMAVPAYDERDWEFAKKMGLEIRPILLPLGGSSEPGASTDGIKREEIEKIVSRGAYTGDGRYINSDFLVTQVGHGVSRGIEKMIAWLEEHNVGQRKVQYKLRDWSVSRQRFWGAPIPMIYNEERKSTKYTYVFIHCRGGSVASNFWPWLKAELESLGHTVVAFDHEAAGVNADKSAALFLDKISFDENTVIVAHSHGGAVAFRILEKLKNRIAKLVLVDAVLRPEFNDKRRPDVEQSTNWVFDFKKIRSIPVETVVLGDRDHPIIPKEQIEEQQRIFDARLVWAKPTLPHFDGAVEDVILQEAVVSGLLPIPESDLPVLLPGDVDFKPTGQSPLTYSDAFQKGVEKKYGKNWKREVDTLDTFMCSSWYYYRYLDPNNDKAFASPESLKTWMPVDFYLGGAEHVTGHLLYSRFFTKVLYDAGYISFGEPFLKHRHQGLILGEDHRKMSKRWDNVINPTDVVNEYGADTLRMYEMFMGPLEETKPWSTDGVKGIRRFLERVWRLQEKLETRNSKLETNSNIEKLINKTIKKVTEDMEAMKFNTAIAKMMELVNAFTKESSILNIQYSIFLKLLCPFAPHIAEELWALLGNKSSITTEPWPTYDPALIQDEEITIVVQVNGKLRDQFVAPADISEEDAKAKALSSPKIQKWLDGKEPKKVMYVKGKLVSIVTGE